jgi:hypothetical protein
MPRSAITRGVLQGIDQTQNIRAGSKKTVEGTVGGVAFTLAAWAALLLACGCWRGAKGGFLGLPLLGGDSLSWTGTPTRDPFPARGNGTAGCKCSWSACVCGKCWRVSLKLWSP